jgi:hypothetical protein
MAGHANTPPDDAAPLGLQVRFFWGDALLQTLQLPRPAETYIGATARCAFPLDAALLGAPEHALVTNLQQRFAIHVGDGMQASLERGGCQAPLPPGIYELRPSDVARVGLGALQAEIAFAPAPPRARGRWSDSVDLRMLNLLLVLGLAAGLFSIAAATREEADVVGDELASVGPYIKYVVRATPPPPPAHLGVPALQLPVDAPAAPQPPGKEGRAGDPKQRATSGRAASPAPSLQALSNPRGLLSPLAHAGEGLAKALSGGLGGGELAQAVGNLHGPSVGAANGEGGLFLKDSGSGGGGPPEAQSIGRIPTRGLPGAPVVSLRRDDKPRQVPPRIDDEVDVTGTFDRDLIRKVIRDHVGQFRYCYERELRARPGLAGKLSVRFVISPTGAVRAAEVAGDSPLQDRGLGECVTARLRDLNFPPPKGGRGEAVVHYPFVFTETP